MNDAERKAVYEQLLADAEKRGDRGASSSMMQGVLGGVDLARSDRADKMWADRLAASQSSGQSMLNAYASALAAQRAKVGRRGGGGGRGGSGGGGGGVTQGIIYSDPARYAADPYALTAPSSMPTYRRPTTQRPGRMPMRYS